MFIHFNFKRMSNVVYSALVNARDRDLNIITGRAILFMNRFSDTTQQQSLFFQLFVVIVLKQRQ